MLFILTLFVVRAKFRVYKAKSHAERTQPSSGSVINVTNNQTTYSNNTVTNYKDSQITNVYDISNTKSKRINITSITITLIIAISVVFIIVFIFVYGGSSKDDPPPSSTPVETPIVATASIATPTPTPTPTNAAEPAWLTDFQPLTNDGVDIYPGDVTDNVGDVHYHRIFGVSGSKIKFYLRGDYKTLSGIWYVCLRDYETTVSSGCKIYADGDLVYTAPSIQGGDVPVEFSIDIDFCEYLEVHFTSGNGEAELGDLKVQ